MAPELPDCSSSLAGNKVHLGLPGQLVIKHDTEILRDWSNIKHCGTTLHFRWSIQTPTGSHKHNLGFTGI